MNAATLNRFCQLAGRTPEWEWQPGGAAPGGGCGWQCVLRVPGVPFVCHGAASNKKKAQEQATEEFVAHLNNSGLVDALLGPPSSKRQRTGAAPIAPAAKGPQPAGGQISDADFQLMLEVLRRSSPDEALLVAQRRLAHAPHCISVSQLSKLIQAVGVRSKASEVLRWLDGLDAMQLLSFPSPAAQRYYGRLARWIIRELVAQSQNALEQANKLPVEALERLGVCVPRLMARQGKGGLEMVLEPARPLPDGHCFQKGDWLFLTFPPDGQVGVAAAPPPPSEAPPGGSITFEAELVGLGGEPGDGTLTVKVSGSNRIAVGRLAKKSCRVDRAVNRVTFTRQVEALKGLCCGGDGSRSAPPSWLRAVLMSSDEQEVRGVAAPPGFEANICRELHRDLKFAASSPLWQQGNTSQQKALKAAMSRRLTLVQGPPGSGKTHTALLMLRLWLSGKYSPALATADSNVAVDNLLSGSAAAALDVVRVGRPESARQDLEQYNLIEKCRAVGGKPAGLLPRAEQSSWGEERKLLARSEVVCCTCSGADHPVLQGMEFQNIIIDEAAQSTEPSVLVPLQRLSSTGSVVLIGDHNQLPPTVVDLESEAAGLGTSLFERLVTRGVAPILLEAQYRMHPAIADFPSRHFYKGLLRSAVRGGTRPAPRGIQWPDARAPVAFLPVEGREVREGNSCSNMAEVSAVEALLSSVLAARELQPCDIGVITPYAAQVRLIRRTLCSSKLLPSGSVSRTTSRRAAGDLGIEVCSVDGFQGREKELIIVSTVRANLGGVVGFLADRRRLNVTLTRARRGLLVCGHLQTLTQDGAGWRPWLVWALERGLVAGHEATNPVVASEFFELDGMSEEKFLGLVS